MANQGNGASLQKGWRALSDKPIFYLLKQKSDRWPYSVKTIKGAFEWKFLAAIVKTLAHR